MAVNKSAIKTPMIAMTTRSSTRVKPSFFAQAAPPLYFYIYVFHCFLLAIGCEKLYNGFRNGFRR
jgi:hypothetical protein